MKINVAVEKYIFVAKKSILAAKKSILAPKKSILAAKKSRETEFYYLGFKTSHIESGRVSKSITCDSKSGRMHHSNLVARDFCSDVLASFYFFGKCCHIVLS